MNLTELIQACRESEDIEASATQLIGHASPALRKQLAAKWLIEEVKRLDRADVLSRERRSIRISMYRSAREERQAAARREAERAHANGPAGNRARRRWLEETVEGRAQAERDAQYAEEMREIDERRDAKIASIMKDWSTQLRAEWTEELLNSGFALPDGQTVLWGDATIEQHEARRNQFMDNARANIEGAARHEAAIETLRSSGAETLRQMVYAKAS